MKFFLAASKICAVQIQIMKNRASWGMTVVVFSLLKLIQRFRVFSQSNQEILSCCICDYNQKEKCNAIL